ncbi:lasso peptide biosynthesis PqqD family chaperone [Streptomyces sp. NPDC055815]
MTLTLRRGVSFAQTDDGLALLDEHGGRYWHLNPTGAQVLRALLDGRTAEEAVTQLTAEYEVDAESAHHDVQELVTALLAAGLVVAVHEQPRDVGRGGAERGGS